MGEAGEAQNITHQQKMGTTSLKEFRDKFKIPISDDKSTTYLFKTRERFERI